MTEKYSLAGYIKRDEAEYGFLIPVYERNGGYYFHKLARDSKHIENFTPYRYEEYDHRENFIPVRYGYERAFSSHLPYGKPVKLKAPRLAGISDQPIFVFKAGGHVAIGSLRNFAFRRRMARLLADPRFDTDYLKKEIKKIFAGDVLFRKIMKSQGTKAVTS